MAFNASYIVLIFFWILVLLFNRKEIKYANTLTSSDRRYIYWSQIIIFLGVLFRTIYLSSFPAGVFPDEAINGYDSWCLANYGVDQHLSYYPVYLRSWGSGQSALYAYLGIPFIKLFGLSSGVYRLPMALISCTSIIVFYYTFRRYSRNYLLVFVVVLIFFLNPWHIMKSRWALDCNLAPDFILLGISLIILGYHALSERKQSLYYATGCIFFVLAAYSYGVGWFMLPFLVLFLGIYLYKKKKIKICQIGFCIVAMTALAFPLILFALNLASGGEQYQLGIITITQLKESRHAATTLLDGGNIFLFVWDAFRLIVVGDDKLVWNSFRYIGQFYNILGIPFFILAYVQLIKKKSFNLFDIVFTIWLIASFPIILTVGANTNHWNILWFPVIYFVARGLAFRIEKGRWAKTVAISLIGLLTVIFTVKYICFFNEKNPVNNWFAKGIEQHIRFVGQKGFDKVYYPSDIVHVTSLFYSPVSPYLFDKTKEPKEAGMPIEHMKKYSNNYFCLPGQILPLPKTAYIIPNRDLEKYVIEYDKFNVDRGDLYTLFWTD
ncbi:MAG: hypothetical protein LBL79_10395 [Prevotella sp.]|jgi:uncharacterized membrane protein|nr:hypothetical protein [Prevotella sp.]